MTFNIRQKTNIINKTKKRNMKDLDAIIQQYLKFIKSMSNNHSNRTYQLHNLEVKYENKYQRIEIKTDLNAIIQYFLKFIKLMSNDHLKQTNQFENLENKYFERY